MMRCVHCDSELIAPEARLSHLALPEMLRLFFVCGLFSRIRTRFTNGRSALRQQFAADAGRASGADLLSYKAGATRALW